eukprot:g61050.t1
MSFRRLVTPVRALWTRSSAAFPLLAAGSSLLAAGVIVQIIRYFSRNRRRVAPPAHKAVEALLALPGVKVQNTYALQEKWDKICKEGFANLAVLIDYDNTMTLPSSLSSWGVVEQTGLFSSAYHEQTKNNYRKYNPIERDASLSLEEKVRHMQDWVRLTHEALVKEAPRRDKMEEVIRAHVDKVNFRDGMEHMFATLRQREVPVLVLSAGLGNVIEIILQLKRLRDPHQPSRNVHIISNFMEFDEKGVFNGWRGEAIHVFNKNETVLHGSPFGAQMAARRNVLLLGDSLGDTNMNEGVSADCVLRVGFFNESVHPPSSLPFYLDAYDLVCVGDRSSFAPVNQLLQAVGLQQA